MVRSRLRAFAFLFVRLLAAELEDVSATGTTCTSPPEGFRSSDPALQADAPAVGSCLPTGEEEDEEVAAMRIELLQTRASATAASREATELDLERSYELKDTSNGHGTWHDTEHAVTIVRHDRHNVAPPSTPQYTGNLCTSRDYQCGGNDLTHDPAHADAESECCSQCQQTPGCKAWTWNIGSKECYPKTSCPHPSQSDDQNQWLWTTTNEQKSGWLVQSRAQRLCNGQLLQLFHQTTMAACKSILATGFLRGHGGLMDSGIYFCESAQETAGKAEHHGCLIEALVQVGNVMDLMTAQVPDSDRDGKTGDRLRDMGFDSTTTSEQGIEWAIYFKDQVVDMIAYPSTTTGGKAGPFVNGKWYLDTGKVPSACASSKVSTYHHELLGKKHEEQARAVLKESGMTDLEPSSNTR
jgi:hypothetical protein